MIAPTLSGPWLAMQATMAASLQHDVAHRWLCAQYGLPDLKAMPGRDGLARPTAAWVLAHLAQHQALDKALGVREQAFAKGSRSVADLASPAWRDLHRRRHDLYSRIVNTR